MKLNNNVVEPGCETSVTKKKWQTPEVIVLSSDDTENALGGGMDGPMMSPAGPINS